MAFSLIPSLALIYGTSMVVYKSDRSNNGFEHAFRVYGLNMEAGKDEFDFESCMAKMAFSPSYTVYISTICLPRFEKT